MPASTETFLVTGAAGCIGAWALRLLLDEGVPVVATDLSPDLRRFRLISRGQTDDGLDDQALPGRTGRRPPLPGPGVIRPVSYSR